MQRLKILRQQAGMTAYELSREAKCVTHIVYVLEKRQTPQKSVAMMLRIAQVLAERLGKPVQDVLYEICADQELKGGPDARRNETDQPRTGENRRTAAPH